MCVATTFMASAGGGWYSYFKIFLPYYLEDVSLEAYSLYFKTQGVSIRFYEINFVEIFIYLTKIWGILWSSGTEPLVLSTYQTLRYFLWNIW
jgi:hypothetical protein